MALCAVARVGDTANAPTRMTSFLSTLTSLKHLGLRLAIRRHQIRLRFSADTRRLYARVLFCQQEISSALRFSSYTHDTHLHVMRRLFMRQDPFPRSSKISRRGAVGKIGAAAGIAVFAPSLVADQAP